MTADIVSQLTRPDNRRYLPGLDHPVGHFIQDYNVGGGKLLWEMGAEIVLLANNPVVQSLDPVKALINFTLRPEETIQAYKDMGAGIVSLVSNPAVQSLSPVGGLVNFTLRPEETNQAIAESITSIIQPYTDAINSGHPGEALGRGVTAVVTLIPPGGGAIGGAARVTSTTSGAAAGAARTTRTFGEGARGSDAALPPRLEITAPPPRLEITAPPPRLAITGKPATERLPTPPHAFVVSPNGETVAAPIRDYVFVSDLATGRVTRQPSMPRIQIDTPPVDSFDNPLPLGTSLPHRIEVPARTYAAESNWSGLLRSAGINQASSPITPHTLEHIFHGQMNPNGGAVGFHDVTAVLRNPDTRVLQGTHRTGLHGIQRANVEVQGIQKRMPSSFFPHNWTEQNIIRAIQEAYDSSRSIPGKPQNYREGRSANGVTIGMYLHSDGNLSTAFPTAPHAAIAVHGNGEAISRSAAQVPWGDW